MTAPDLISVAEAASRLGVDENTVYRMLTSADPPPWAIRVGRRWRVSVPLLELAIGGALPPPVINNAVVLDYLAEHPDVLMVALRRALFPGG